jgi:hypothetical protein
MSGQVFFPPRNAAHSTRCPGWLALLVLTALLGSTRARADASEQCASAYENAQLFRMRGHLVEARDALLVCLQNSCPQLLRGDCMAWLPQVEQGLPSVVFAVTDVRGHDLTGARVFADGKLLEGYLDGRAHPIDPGVYKLRFEAPGHRPEEQPLTIREGEKNRMVRARLASTEPAPALTSGTPAPGVISNDVPAQPKPKSKVHIPTATLVLGGSAVVGFAAMTAFAVAGKHEHDRLEKSCAPECSEDSTKRGRRAYILADVSLGLSLGLTAAALWTYFAGRDVEPESPPPVALNVSRQGLSASLTTRF